MFILIIIIGSLLGQILSPKIATALEGKEIDWIAHAITCFVISVFFLISWTECSSEIEELKQEISNLKGEE